MNSSVRSTSAAAAVFALLAPSLFVAPAFADDKKKNPDEIGNRDVEQGDYP